MMMMGNHDITAKEWEEIREADKKEYEAKAKLLRENIELLIPEIFDRATIRDVQLYKESIFLYIRNNCIHIYNNKSAIKSFVQHYYNYLIGRANVDDHIYLYSVTGENRYLDKLRKEFVRLRDEMRIFYLQKEKTLIENDDQFLDKVLSDEYSNELNDNMSSLYEKLNSDIDESEKEKVLNEIEDIRIALNNIYILGFMKKNCSVLSDSRPTIRKVIRK